MTSFRGPFSRQRPSLRHEWGGEAGQTTAAVVATEAFRGSSTMKRQKIRSLMQGTQLFGATAKRGISLLVLTTYLTLISAPAAAAVRQEVFGRPKPLTDSSASASELASMRESMRRFRLEQRLMPKDTSALATLKGFFTDSPKVQAERRLADGLLASRTKLLNEAAEQDKSLAATRTDLLKKHLPAVVLARHDAAVKTIASRRADLLSTLDRLQQAQTKEKADQRAQLLEDLDKKLEQWGGEKAAKTDYKHLPWGSPDSKVRAPRDSKLAYSLHLDMFGIKPLRVAGPIPAGTVLPVLPQLPSTAQAADLTETEDIKLTDAIRAKALELHKNPSEIYRWVHDNVEYIPTYGSVQGADYALQTKRANAFDTASLLIALLRASNIPARYVYGTIEVPIDQAMNWVGGVTNPDAVLNLMGQGGIPNVGLTQGGKIVAVRMEHVWVEAFIDYVPSRGVVNKTPDTWIPLDASFKQYTYTAPLDIKTAVPFDAQALVNNVQAGATIDEAQGYVQNIDQSKIQTALTSYQTQVKSYLEQQQPNATVGDIIGTKVIKPYQGKLLAQELPVALVATAGDFQSLPDTMRHYFNYAVYSDVLSRDTDSPTIQRKLSLPYLAGKSLALSFSPATPDDEATISSYLPRPHADGTPIDPSELPSSLPGYLINVLPELTVDGQVVAAGDAQMLGSDVFTRASITSPNSSLSDVISENRIAAGEYHAIGVDGQGLSATQLAALKVRLEQTKQKLENRQFEEVTNHNLMGGILQAGVQSYFAVNDVQDQIAARSSKVVVNRLPSYGSFSSTLQAQYSWGIPRQVRAAGVSMDMDRVSTSAIDNENDGNRLNAYQVSAGNRMSIAESLIPEQIFSTEAIKADGVSAVKALQIAAQQGQRIYTITKANAEQSLSELTFNQSARDEIANAVAAGYQVTTSQGALTYAGWTGFGYIVKDAQTGMAAYKISGGQNGAALLASRMDETAMLSLGNQYDSGASSLIDGAIPASSVESTAQAVKDCLGDRVGLAVVLGIVAAAVAIAVARMPAAILVIATALMAIIFSQEAAAVNVVLPSECVCSSGIVGVDNGVPQCWICDKLQHPVLTAAVDAAKDLVSYAGGGCYANDEHAILARKYTAWDAEWAARKNENVCWRPVGVNHKDKELIAFRKASECLGYMGGQ